MLDMENIELPKLENDQKSYAGIPEAVFVVSNILLCRPFASTNPDSSKP